ncbi:MAG: glycosyltransferase [Candidatus Falkowbacteria bacterium]
MANITFAIFTYNEAERITYVIRNFIPFGEVILFDGGSTDNTQEVAERLGAKFYTRPDLDRAETAKNLDFIKSKISNEWLYWAFADNLAPKSLISELIKIASQDRYKIVYAPMYTYLWGNTENFAQKYYAPVLFHKDYIEFHHKIHSMGRFTGEKNQVLRLPNKKEFALLHYSTYNIEKFTQRYLQYANIEAGDKFKDGERFSLLKLFAAMIRWAWYLRSSLKNLRLGIIITLSFAFSRLLTYARLYEIENGIDLEKIEKNYSDSKEKLLKTNEW